MRSSIAALAALVLLSASAARADTLIDNVNGVTFDEQGQVARFAAMIIDSDGRVVRLLATGDEQPDNVEQRIDGQGRVALPGLIDSHVQLADFGFAALQLDLSGTRSLREVQFALGAYAQTHPERAWIVGTGWDHTAWDRPELPQALDLDAVVSDRPVWLISADGRYGWANGLALRAAGVTSETADPDGGTIVRLSETREPSGVLENGARGLVDRAIPPPTGADRDRALARAEEIMLSQGITAVADMGTSLANWLAYRRAGDLGRLTLRIMAYAEDVETAELIGGPGPGPWLYDDRLRLNGVALRLDGPLDRRQAWLKAPYADAAETSGAALIDATELAYRLHRAASGNFQVAAAAHGDAATSHLLDAIEALPAAARGERRWRIEAAGVVDPADAGRIAAAGLVVSVVPQLIATERLQVEQRLGDARLDRAFAWKSQAEAGAVLAFGSNAPALAPAPFAGIAAAETRAGPDGEPFGGWQPAQRLTREAALAAATVGGASAGLADARFGRLAPGQRADFILVDRDPLLATPDELRATRVIETWVSGRKVYQAPELPLAIPRLPEESE